MKIFKKISTELNNIKFCKDLEKRFDELITSNPNENAFYLKVENDNFLRSNKGLYAGVTSMEKNNKVCYILITDHAFKTLPSIVKNFILLHEEGHIRNGDALSEEKRTLKKEICADFNAVSILGKENALIALNEFLKIYKNSANNKKGLIELKYRIKAIEECC